MWRTPRGERRLHGCEAALLQELLGYVYDQIDVISRLSRIPYESGVTVFDRLQASQQLALLAEVGHALLRDGPAPELTAVREATIAVLFAELRDGISFEIDNEGSFPADLSWRELLLTAYRECCSDDDDLPDVCSTDLGTWEELAGVLADGMLWDADWEMEDLFVDGDPDASAALKRLMRVSDDYYRAIPLDPTEDQLSGLRTVLNELTGYMGSDPVYSFPDELKTVNRV